MTRRFISSLTCCLLLFAATSGKTSRAADINTELEKLIGQFVSQALRDASGVDKDPLLANWVKSMGATVSARSPRRDLPYTFQILQTDVANALAAPGGTIFVTRGLLDSVNSDDELASVLGHETGHVAKRHAMQQIGANLLFVAALTALRGGKYDKLRTGATIFNVLRTLQKSREMEAQADEVGIQIAYDAGYDPSGLVHFFEGLGPSNRSRVTDYFSTHPAPEKRIVSARKSPLVTKTGDATRGKIAEGYAARGLRGEADVVRQGGDPLQVPPLPLFSTLAPTVAAERESVYQKSEALRRALVPAYQAGNTGRILQQVLLINNQPGDARWLYLAARAYAVQSDVDDLSARTLRVARTAPATYDALARYAGKNETDAPPFSLESSLGRTEVKNALDKAKGATTPIVRASRTLATVLADLNNRFYQPKGATGWLRYGALEGLLRYAESELARADKASGTAWRILSLARIRRYEARLTELIPEENTGRRALWQDLTRRRFGTTFPLEGQTGPSTVRAALAIQLQVSPNEAEKGRGSSEPWAEWVLTRKGVPENIATAMRLLTLDLERETAAENRYQQAASD